MARVRNEHGAWTQCSSSPWRHFVANTPIFLDYTSFNPASLSFRNFSQLYDCVGPVASTPYGKKVQKNIFTLWAESTWSTETDDHSAAPADERMNNKKNTYECHDIKLSQSQSTLIDWLADWLTETSVQCSIWALMLVVLAFGGSLHSILC